MDEQDSQKAGPRLTGVLRRFEQAVVLALVGMMAIVVMLSLVELGWILARDVLTHPILLLEVDELLELFGLFLLVLIGLELLETVKAYLHHRVVYVEIVLEVALIALARKVVVLDVGKEGALGVLALAALIAALAAAIRLHRQRGPNSSNARG